MPPEIEVIVCEEDSAGMTDEQLLKRLQEGDENAFTQLYNRRKEPLFRFALQMSSSAALAEDVLQEVFMTLIEGKAHYDPAKGTLASFLYGIARNHVLTILRKDRRYSVPEVQDSDETTALDIAANDATPLDGILLDERLEEVRRTVSKLPAQYKEAVVLCDLHELTYEEAASITGCAIGTLRSRLHRGRQLIIQKLLRSKDNLETSREEKPTRSNDDRKTKSSSPVFTISYGRCES